MSKKIYIGENDLIKIKRFMTGRKTGHKPFIAENEPPYEKDEFEIGGEGGNNDYFHINESAHADLDIIDSISYSVDEKYYFDEEEYKHWYDNYDSEDEYLKSCERYDGEVYDTDGNHIDFFSGDRDEIEYYFRDNLYIAEKIFNKEGRYSQGEYWITDIQDEFVNEVDININDVDSVNKAAKRLSNPNGPSLYILTDGSIISFHDHAQIQSVCDEMTISKFLELGNIRCGGGNVVSIELIKKPTFEQQQILLNMLSYADEAIVDFAVPNKNNNMYPETIYSVSYVRPNNKRVVNDIMNYFWEGIKPQGSGFYEAKEGKQVINEYNADLRLPFEEPEYANKFYIEQYKDWLEDYGKYGSLPSGTLEFWDEIKQAVVEIKAKQLHGRFDGSIPEDKNADEIFYDLQTRLIGPYIKFTNDGKVYVERAISINKRPRGYDNSQRTDFYKQLWKDYNDNVGGCWSYCKDGAQAYCGDDYGYSIILRGYIRTDDIDFIKTVQLNYHYPGEHEIRVKPFAKVELFNFSYGNDTINFNKRLIVSSTYSGNNSKFIGNVGKIDDGFGGITYINRQNKVLNGEEEYNNELNKYVDDCLAKGYELSDIFDYCGDFKNGFASVKLDEKWTFIREDGKRINNEWYDFCSNFANGFARVRLGKKWTFISEDGKRINNEWYDFCGSFINSFARVNLGEKWTFIREDGAYLNNEWYDYCDSFKNGFAVVLMGNKETFIREDGKRLNNEWYDYCNNFKNGFAKVKIDNKWYNIDTSGRRFTAESVNKNSKKLIMNENQLIALKENIETEVESNEVNLSSFKKNDSLAKRIWDGMDLNPRVRLKLLDIADDFWDFTDINWVKPKGIHLTGSICNFNWSDESDIDLHLVVDFSEVDDRKDFVQEYFNSKKNEWNEEHSNLKIFGYPVELYVEDVNAETVSSGIYDLEENKWISEPSKDEIEEIGLDKYEIKSLAAKLMTKIDDLYDEFSATDDDAKLRSIGERADKLLSSIKQMRKDGLSRGGESDPFNVVYKVLRRADYLENLFNLKSELYDKLNSIDIEESVIKYYYNKICPLNEEIVADGSAEHNPFKKRWKYEREALKSYLCNNGEIMTSKENGKQYKVIFDTMLSQRLGLNYCICIQWNPITMEPGNIIYVRAYDKFTKKIFTPQFDARGYDNVQGTSDDLNVY